MTGVRKKAQAHRHAPAPPQHGGSTATAVAAAAAVADSIEASRAADAPSAAENLLPGITEALHPTPKKPADTLTINIPPPKGALKQVLEELQQFSAESGNLDTFLTYLLLNNRPADAFRLVTFLLRSDPDHKLGIDIWHGALLATRKRYDEVEAALKGDGEATWSKYLEAAKYIGAIDVPAVAWLAEHAVAREPHAVPALEELARAQHAMDDPTATLKTIARIEALEPLQWQSRILRADSYMRLGRWEDARADVQAVLLISPTVGHFHASMAGIHAEAGEVEAVHACFAKIDELKINTLTGMRSLIHAACTINDASLLRRCYDHIVEMRYVEADGFIELIDGHARNGSLAQAIIVGRLATRLVRRNASLHQLMGDLLSASGAHADAAVSYAQALKLETPDVALQLLFAQASLGAGQLKEAHAAFKAVLATCPKNLQALRGVLAILKIRSAPAPETVEWLHKALLQAPDDVQLAQDFVAAANAPKNRAYRRRAIAVLERLHAQSPDVAMWRTQLANFIRAQDPERALTLAQGAVAAAPEDVAAQAALGATEAEMERLQAARDFTLKAIPLPGSGMAALPPNRVTFEAFAQQVTGIEVGKTYQNRAAVRTADGTLYWAPWSVSGGASVGAVASLKAGLAFAVPDGIAKRFDALFASQVFDTASVQDFHNVLCERGECFLSGGAVRDIIADPHNAVPRDIDLTATLAPSLVRLSTGSLAGTTPGLDDRPCGIVSPYPLEYYGLVKFGTVEAGVVQAKLDVMSMRSFGALEPMQQVVGARQPVKPVAFGPDMHADALFRDFTCNALYYDPKTRILFDPTGTGKVDAALKRLQLCSMEHIYKNECLGWRYLKMRQTGYTGTERTRRAIASHFAHYLSQPDAAVWLKRSLHRVFPELTKKLKAAAWHTAIEGILHEDDIADATLLTALALAL